MPCGLSLNHLVRTQQQRLRNRYPERLSGPEVDHELKLRRLFHGQVAGIGAFEYLVDVSRGSAKLIPEARTVGHEKTCFGLTSEQGNRWQTMCLGNLGNLCSVPAGHLRARDD